MIGCPTCRFWKATEMHAAPTTNAPHHIREAERRTELMRATEALCTWEPNQSLLGQFPTWARKRVNHGNLTNEDEGLNCPAWSPRDKPLTHPLT